MQLQADYNTLLLLDIDIRKQQKASLAFNFFMQEKCKRFYQNNNMRLQIAFNRLQEYQKEHVLQNDKGEFKSNDKGDFVFKTDADGVEYNAKIEAFLKSNITIFL